MYCCTLRVMQSTVHRSSCYSCVSFDILRFEWIGNVKFPQKLTVITYKVKG